MCYQHYDRQYYAKTGVAPAGAIHELAFKLGTADLDQLVSDIGSLLIERFLGGNSNETTGDISLGCAGAVIRNGMVAEKRLQITWRSFQRGGTFGTWERPNPNSSSGCPAAHLMRSII